MRPSSLFVLASVIAILSGGCRTTTTSTTSTSSATTATATDSTVAQGDPGPFTSNNGATLCEGNCEEKAHYKKPFLLEEGETNSLQQAVSAAGSGGHVVATKAGNSFRFHAVSSPMPADHASRLAVGANQPVKVELSPEALQLAHEREASH